MKKVLAFLLVACMLLTCLPAMAAGEDVQVFVDGEAVTFDVPPTIEQGRTLVPLRAIFEALGAYVDYYEDGGKQYVTASGGPNYIELIIGDSAMKVNDSRVTLEVPAKIVSGRTLIPLRAVSEALGTNVIWDDATRTIRIEKPQADVYPVASTLTSYDVLKDKTVPAYFDLTENITEDANGGHTLSFLVYEMETFDFSTRPLKVGDRVCVEGWNYTVRTLKEDGKNISVNEDAYGDSELYFVPLEDGSGLYRIMGMDDYATYTPLFLLELPISPDVVLTDAGNSDIFPNTTTVRGADVYPYLRSLTEGNDYFVYLNTTVTVKDGVVTGINRIYTP